MEWTKKIVEYQAPPPMQAWHDIEKALNKSGESLYNHAAVPPNESWDAISARLSSTANDQTGKIYAWLRPVLRYAAIVLLVAFATTTLINSSFRNALFESIKGPGMKAALTDTPQHIKKDTNNTKLLQKQLRQQTP
jgi:hypothetical protein